MSLRRLGALAGTVAIGTVTIAVLALIFVAYLSPGHVFDWLAMVSLCT